MPLDLRLHSVGWLSGVLVPAWAGFLDRAWDAVSDAPPSEAPQVMDGTIGLWIKRLSGDVSSPPSQQELADLDWVVENLDEINKNIQTALVNWLTPNHPQAMPYFDSFIEFPEVHNIDDLKPLISPNGLAVVDYRPGPLPYLAFSAGCLWDYEHGLAVLLYGAEVVEVCNIMESRTQWIYEEDAERRGLVSPCS